MTNSIGSNFVNLYYNNRDLRDRMNIYKIQNSSYYLRQDSRSSRRLVFFGSVDFDQALRNKDSLLLEKQHIIHRNCLDTFTQQSSFETGFCSPLNFAAVLNFTGTAKRDDFLSFYISFFSKHLTGFEYSSSINASCFLIYYKETLNYLKFLSYKWQAKRNVLLAEFYLGKEAKTLSKEEIKKAVSPYLEKYDEKTLYGEIYTTKNRNLS